MRDKLGRFLKGTHVSPKTEIKKGQHLSSITEFKKGFKHTEEQIRHRSETIKGSIRKPKIKKICLSCNKEFKVYPSLQRIGHCSNICANKSRIGKKIGENHWNWKGGVSKNREYRKKANKIWKARNRLKLKAYAHKRRGGGILSIKMIQLVYEDNIKKYGTLTCYLCLKPIEFKQDCLEHKTPLSRGGTSEYKNLAVAHRSCNSKKNIKTEAEYRKGFLCKT